MLLIEFAINLYLFGQLQSTQMLIRLLIVEYKICFRGGC